MRRTRLAAVTALGAALALAVPVDASANEVTKWNELALSTINAQPPIASAPPAAGVFMAMVHGAVYGAVNAVDRHGRPYLVDRSYPMASVDAAAATAAFRVLDTLFPGNATVQAAYTSSLLAVPDGPLEDAGVAVGRAAADAILAEGHDARTLIGCTFGTGLPGVWEPQPTATGAPACDPSPWIANAVPFVVRSAMQFRTPGPLALGSEAYAAELNEVKAIGSLTSTTRTAAQTHVAAFWQTGPAANYNAMARRFVDRFGLDTSDSARLFALLDLSAADAIITTWSDKYARNFWRPITAIRKADADGNPATSADPGWKSMFDASLDPAIGGAGPALGTPPYPEHPSGATAYASASMHAFAAFFGTDEVSFYATSSRFPAEQRAFARFSDLTREIVDARVWAGIHFRAADVQAAGLGAEVARYVHTHQFAAAH